MPVLSRRFSIIFGFGVFILVLIAAFGVTRGELALQLQSNFRVAHTRQVLLEIARTQSLLQDAETGQRGFLYTGQSRYLGPYNAARTQIEAQLDTLARLTADNPRQQASIRELRGLAHEKLSEMEQTIVLARSGKQEQAKSLVLSGSGLEIMDGIRSIVDRMNAEELALERARTDRYRRSIRITLAALYSTTAVAILGTLLLAFTMLRAMAAQARYAQEIQLREEWFRVTLTSIGDAVIATDHEGRVTFFNPIAEDLTGVRLSAVKGRNIQEVFPIFNEFTGAAAENPVAKVMEKRIVIGLANHTVLRHADGRMIPIEDSAAPITGDKGQLIGVVLVFRDVTSERKSQDMLRKSEKLSAAARLSATVAHEINNPLEAVGNLIYIAKLTPGAPAQVVDQLTLAEQNWRVSPISLARRLVFIAKPMCRSSSL